MRPTKQQIKNLQDLTKKKFDSITSSPVAVEIKLKDSELESFWGLAYCQTELDAMRLLQFNLEDAYVSYCSITKKWVVSYEG